VKSKRKTAKRRKHARRITAHAAKVAAAALARADGEELEDPEADGDPADPPPLPAIPGTDGPAAPPPAALVALGTPPDDPLAAQSWLHRAMVVSAHDAMNDGTISAKERRRELRTISAAAARLMPDARRWEAEQLILSNQRELEAKAKAKRGAKLEAAPPRTAPPANIEDPNAGDFGGGSGDGS